MTKSEIIEMLQQDIFTVTFTKVNGETRTMPCTLRTDLLPAAEEVKEATTPRKQNDSVLSVWCTDKQAWRSFRVDSVSAIVRGI